MNIVISTRLIILLIILVNIFETAYSADRYETLTKLNLSATQKLQIEQIQNENNLEILSLQENIKITQNKLNSVLSSDLSSDQEVNNLKNLIGSYQSKISDLKTKSWKQIRFILTPTQREEIRKQQFSQ